MSRLPALVPISLAVQASRNLMPGCKSYSAIMRGCMQQGNRNVRCSSDRGRARPGATVSTIQKDMVHASRGRGHRHCSPQPAVRSCSGPLASLGLPGPR
jgi:hypothetical protein